MIYQVISPMSAVIEGDSYKEAIKNFIKINYALNIRNMIVKDRLNHYQANINYYKENEKNKIGITIYPYDGTLPIFKETPVGNQRVAQIIQQPLIPIIQQPLIPIIQQPLINNIKPIISAPGMVSATENGAVFPIKFFP
jgi:hypothetical protein